MIFFKIIEFYFLKISKSDELEVKKLLSKDEYNIFYNMLGYDKYHSFKVDEDIKVQNMPNIYLKLALLHDCGKGNCGFLLRVLHKLGFKTSLRNHSLNGYIKLKDINPQLANLILKHHNSTEDEYMKKFQGVDDVN